MIDFASLSVGSLIEGDAPLSPLDPNERLCLLATKVSSGESPTAEFKLTLFGVSLGKVNATVKDGVTVWEVCYG